MTTNEQVQAAARAICQSRKFETGEGTCTVLCMDQLDDVRKKGCGHCVRIHGKLAKQVLEAASRATPAKEIAVTEAMKWAGHAALDKSEFAEKGIGARVGYAAMADVFRAMLAKATPAHPALDPATVEACAREAEWEGYGETGRVIAKRILALADAKEAGRHE
jgi:hypothetical protein